MTGSFFLVQTFPDMEGRRTHSVDRGLLTAEKGSQSSVGIRIFYLHPLCSWVSSFILKPKQIVTCRHASSDRHLHNIIRHHSTLPSNLKLNCDFRLNYFNIKLD